MLKRSVLLTTLTLLVACGATAPQTTEPQGEQPANAQLAGPIEGQYIVVLKDSAANLSAQGLEASSLIAQQFGLDPQGLSVLQLYSATINGFAARLSDENLRILRTDPRVKYVEQDAIAEGSATTQTNPTWGLDRTDQRTRPLNGSYTYNNDASTVTAYIIDSGIETTHPEFGGRAVWGNNFTGDGINTDCHGHGTHTSGTVGSNSYGVAKGVKLVAVKVLNCNNYGPWSSILAGIDWAASNRRGPAVANISITGSYSQATNDTVIAAINSGLTVVTAAGNNSANACNYSPASTSQAITVGNVDRYDARRSSSNYGSCVDIFAPGTDITSTFKGGTTATHTGTSMASPHVAGVAAQYLAAFPQATPAEVQAAILSNSTANVLTNLGTGSPNRMLYGLLPGTDISLDPTPTEPTPTEPAPTGPVVTTSPVSGNIYKLVNRRSGLILSAPNSNTAGQQLVQLADNGSSYQRWMLTKDSAGAYIFKSQGSGLAMDVNGGSLSNGAKIIQWTVNNASNQKWNITATDSGFVKLTSVSSGKVVGVLNASVASGAGIVQWDYGTGQNDQWQIVSP